MRIFLSGLVSAVLAGIIARAWVAFINRPVQVPFWIRYEGRVIEGIDRMDRSEVRRQMRVEGKRWPQPPDENTEWVSVAIGTPRCG